MTGTGWTTNAPAAGAASGTVSFTKSSVTNGETARFQIVVKVNGNTNSGSTINDTASVSSTTTDPNSANNSAPATTAVSKADANVTLASSKNPATYGDNVTFTATVTPKSPSTGSPTGTVTFKDGATTLGSGAVDNSGVATLSTSSLNAATHSITAEYSGDTNFNGASSAALSQVVNKAGTSVNVTSSVNPSDFGQSVTFTATVTGPASTPTGAVQFKIDGANAGGAVAVDGNGKATFTTSSLSSGNHTVTADYSGDANFNASSGTLSGGQTVKSPPALSINDVSVAEGNSGTTPATFTVSLSAASSLPVKVDYATADGTANAPSDYQATSGTVTFAPGETTKTATVLVNGDTTYEADETFTVNLTNGQNSTIARSSGTGTIRNDDAQPTIQFSASDYPVGEAAGNATVTVTRTGTTNLPASVHYTMFDGTATSPADYVASSGDVTFAANETSKTITIPIIDDAIDEPDEYFSIMLSGASGATIGTPGSATVTIIDNDPLPTVQFTAAAYSVNENGGSALLTVTRSGDKSTAAVVHFSTSDGTAHAGSDYTATSGDISFPANGSDTQTIGIPITDDSTPESSETFTVTLTATSSANVGAPSTATVTIIDNDSATPTPSPSASPSPTASPSATPTPTPPAPQNISTRAHVGTGDEVVIGGFIVTGSAPKKVIVRGLGPSLTAKGITDALADPVLELHGPDGSLILRNDNWKDTQRSAIEQSQLAPTDDLEAAIVADLPPGVYTAILSGQGTSSGTGLVEIYDLDPAADSTLANISTRGAVDEGDGRMIGGFMLRGNGNGRVVVRALGPSLAASGVQHPLADPTLDVRNANGDSVATNDNWTDDATNAAAVTASGLAPSDQHESALALTLPVGDYTMIVAGKGTDTGIGLVELYNLK